MAYNQMCKLHLANPENPEKPLCRTLKRHTSKNIKLTNREEEVTCKKCREIIMIKKRKKTLKKYDEHYEKHETATISKEEYEMIKKEIQNRYTKN